MNKPRKPTRHERAIKMLLRKQGFSELEGVYQLGFTSGRNDVNKIEERLQIEFNREWEANADEMGKHYRYTCPNRETAQKPITYANFLAGKRGDVAYSEAETEIILSLFN